MRHIGERPWDQFTWNLTNSRLRTYPIGRRLANPWGLHDMYGNVREWCADWYAADDYADSPTENPTGPASGAQRIIRGGCFMDLPPFDRSAGRGHLAPGERINNQGFRIVRDAPDRSHG